MFAGQILFTIVKLHGKWTHTVRPWITVLVSVNINWLHTVLPQIWSIKRVPFQRNTLIDQNNKDCLRPNITKGIQLQSNTRWVHTVQRMSPFAWCISYIVYRISRYNGEMWRKLKTRRKLGTSKLGTTGILTAHRVIFCSVPLKVGSHKTIFVINQSSDIYPPTVVDHCRTIFFHYVPS